MADRIVEAVCADLQARSEWGIAKYGTTLSDNPASHRERLQHAYEEALDLANYLKWAMKTAEEVCELNRQIALLTKVLEMGLALCDSGNHDGTNDACPTCHFANALRVALGKGPPRLDPTILDDGLAP